MARTDNDTWDLASSVGATATFVALQRAIASRDPNPLISDPYADSLVAAVGIEALSRFARGELSENTGTVTAEDLTTISARMQAARQDWRGRGLGGLSEGVYIDIADLFYAGERTEAADYLTGRGWTAELRRNSQLFADYGLAPQREGSSSFGDITYLSATLG